MGYLTRSSAYVAVGAASAQFATVLTNGAKFVVSSTTAAWIKIGANPTAVGRTAGNTYVPPNVPVEIVASDPDDRVAIIQDAAAGHASLTLIAC